MPIRFPDPFRDPTNLPNQDVNPFVSQMVEGAKSGSLPVLYGGLLKGLSGQWRKRFGGFSRLIVEVGCHKGDVLRDLAQDHEDTLFVGLDITFKRVVETAKKAQVTGLENLKSVMANAMGLDLLFGERELDGVIIFYPDPWTRKKRQLKNRLLGNEFIDQMSRLIKPGGFFWFKTDHGGYFHDVVQCLEKSDFLRSMDPPTVSGIMTRSYKSRFESEFERRQVQKFEGVWVRSPGKL